MLIGIVAMTGTGLIGNKDGLPWHIPADLRFFKNLTMGKTLLVGEKTFQTLPPMSGRKLVVYTRDLTKYAQTEDFRAISTIDEVVDLAYSDEVVCLIGGAYMYKVFSHLCDYFYVTIIEEDEYNTFEGDVYFPLATLQDNFDFVSEVEHEDEQTGIKLYFQLYENPKRGK